MLCQNTCGDIFLPWFPMSDSRIAGLKAAGTVVLLAAGIIVMPGRWNTDHWETTSGQQLDDPWKWMPMPPPVNA